MPFFEGARDFEIRGGSFIDVKGDQHNHKTDNSFRLSGTGNTANLSPNLSRQDNRTYNLGYSNTGVNGHYNYGGNFVSPPPPPDFQEFQAFLAWRQQQGLLSAPSLQQTTPSPYNSPMFDQGMNGPNDTRGFGNNSVPGGTYSSPQLGQQYLSPNAQYPQHPHPSPNFPRNLPNSGQYYTPVPPANWESSTSPGHLHQPHTAQPTEHPSHYRSHSQPPPDNASADPLSEFSKVLSESDHTNSIPGFGALRSVQDRFLQQAQNSARSDQPPARPHSTSTLPTPSNIPAGTQASSPSELHRPTHVPQGPSMPVSPDTMTRPNVSPHMPPPVNTATKPPTPQPLLQSLPTPLPANSQVLHQQSVSPQLPQPQPGKKLKRRSSGSSSSSSSSEERHSRMDSMPIPLNGLAKPSPQFSNPGPSSMPVASPPASPTGVPPTNVASSPFRHENETPLSAPASLGTGPMAAAPVPIPTTGSAPVATPFSAFPTLRPLNSLPQVQLSSQGPGSPDDVLSSSKKKKKKSFFHKMGLGRKKSKEGKVVS